MPELNFTITGVEAVERGMTPLLEFGLEVVNTLPEEPVQSVIVHAQIQFQPAHRGYADAEKERLNDLFGTPERWGQTVRNRLWTHAHTTLGAFHDRTAARLQVPCTYDLNIAATKFFYALDSGDVPLLFLFSGTVFYLGSAGLQVQQISWSKESTYLMPSSRWREMMARHYPNSAWLYLQRDVFDRLYAFRRQQGLTSWEQVIERLLPEMEGASL